MGIGFCVVVPAGQAEEAIAISRRHDTPAWRIGYATDEFSNQVRLTQPRLIGENTPIQAGTMKMDFKLEEVGASDRGGPSGHRRGRSRPGRERGASAGVPQGRAVGRRDLRPRPGEGGGDGRQVWRREGVRQPGGASGRSPRGYRRRGGTGRGAEEDRAGSGRDGASICCARSRWRPASKTAGR